MLSSQLISLKNAKNLNAAILCFSPSSLKVNISWKFDNNPEIIPAAPNKARVQRVLKSLSDNNTPAPAAYPKRAEGMDIRRLRTL